MRACLLFLTLLWSLTDARATTWEVGPSEAFTVPSQFSNVVGDGDTVKIAAGVYESDVALAGR